MPICKLDEHSPNLPEASQYWVAPTAYVIGNVQLAKDVGVWFGVTIRGDNEPINIGERSNIQDNSVLHSDTGSPLTIGEGCTIGHSAIVHGCTIGDNSLVGMGATILNNARIGKNSIVGANALVTEGKEFPDNSLIVGSPAKAVRTLDDKAVAGLKASADNYVANAKRFRDGFEIIS